MIKIVPLVYLQQPVTHTNRVEHWFGGHVLYQVHAEPVPLEIPDTDALVYDDALDPYISRWKSEPSIRLALLRRCCRKLSQKRPPAIWSPPLPPDPHIALFEELYTPNASWMKLLKQEWPACIEMIDRLHTEWL